MSSITRTITVTRKGMQHQIQIVEGTSLLPISIIVSDYDILSGSVAVAYNRQPNGTLVNQACTISENTISFTPPEGFYLKGYNKTQVRVTNNNRNLFSFVIDVWCDENITDDADVEEINSQPTLVTQLLSQIGVLTARMDAFTALPEGSTTSDAALNDIRIGYDGTEYPTPGDAVRGQVSSLSEEIDNSYKNNGFYFPSYSKNVGYLDKNGLIRTESQSFIYTNGFNLKFGETLIVVTRVPTNNVAVICEYNNGDYGKPLVISNTDNLSIYEYTAEYDISVSVSFRNEITSSVLIKKQENIEKNIFNELYSTGYIPKIFSEYIDISEIIPVNGYWSGGTGEWRTETGHSLIVQLEKNETYVIKSNGFTTSNMSIVELPSINPSNGNVIGSIDATTEDTITLIKPKTTGIVGIPYNNNVTKKDIFISKAKNGFINRCIETLKEKNVFYVNRRYGYRYNDFDNLIECFNYVKNIIEHKTVYLYPGTYNIYELMGGREYFESVDTSLNWKDVQPVLDNITIKGIGNVIINLDMPSDFEHDLYWLFSALNLRGNFLVENITVLGNNCRYCIHDESNELYPETTHHYKNVRCIKTGNGGQAVGCGYSKNSNVIIEGCHFEIDKNDEAYSYHSKGGLNAIIKNSVFKNTSEDHSIRFSQESNVKDTVSIENSYISSDILLRPEYDYGTDKKNMTRITLINSKTGIKVGDSSFSYESNEEKSIKYNTITGDETVIVE